MPLVAFVVSVQVEDRGIGIKREDFGKLFLLFSKLTDFSGANARGSGLGVRWHAVPLYLVVLALCDSMDLPTPALTRAGVGMWPRRLVLWK